MSRLLSTTEPLLNPLRASRLAACSVAGLLLVCLTLGSAAGQTKSLVIGVDGLGYGTEGLDFASTPVMDSLIAGTWRPEYSGAYSNMAFSGGVLGTATQQTTVSGPGWSTMNTGVWVDQHGVTGNGSSFANGDFTNNPPYLGILKSNFPSLKTASYVNWGPIDDNIMGAIDSDADPTNDLDFRGDYNNDFDVSVAAVVGILGPLDADALFVAFDQVDGAGHSCGSSGSCYRNQIEATDVLIGDLLDAISMRPDFDNEDWQILITSDHGHTPSGGHGGQSDLERTIPFIVSSKTLNQGTLPVVQEVSQADLAPTVLDHFDIPLPSHFWGASRASGAVTINPDLNGDGIVSGDGTGPFATDDVTAFVSFWLQPNTVSNPNPADFNLDGIANLADWSILNAELPHMGDAIMTALTPEPGSHVIALTMLLLSVGILRRKRNRHA